MKKELAKLIRKKILKYRCLNENDPNKSIIRNELYEMIQPTMMSWLYSFHKKKGVFNSKEEILSKSWDCFEFCLKYYKPDRGIPVQNHFYNYTRFCMLTYFNSKQDYTSTDQELSNLQGDSDCDRLYENIDILKTFRNSLPKEYTLVFDDALMSLVPHTPDRLSRKDETALPYRRYLESKKVFKWVIDFLIRQ